MALDPRRVKDLFLAALDRPDPADRPAFLDRESGDDRELRRRLEGPLAAHDQPAIELEPPIAAKATTVEADLTTAGSGTPAEKTGKPDEAKAWRDEKAKLLAKATTSRTAEENR